MTKEEIKAKIHAAEFKAKQKIEEKKYQATVWWAKNRDDVIRLAPVIIGGATIAHKSISKHAAKRERKELVEKRVWDPSRGIWYETRRPLSNKQRLTLDRLKSKGMSTGEALREMGVLR